MKKLLLLSLCFFSLCASQLYAQTRAVTGTVLAKDDGLPLPGVTVTVKNTNTGTQTNAEGKYTINAPAGATLVFSFIGYTTLEIPATGNTVNATMSGSSRQLGEVVITGALGQQRQKKDIGYAATTINNATLNAGNAVNVANGLQGKVSGLNITTTNSGVFENVKITLRGIRSLTGNNSPMLLIDGVQADINLMSSINGNDIEDVTILKGAQAAGIYGSDASNGVIVITTKKGTRDGKPVITVTNSTQFTKVSKFPEFQRMFGLGGGGTTANSQGEYVPIENWSWGPAYTGQPIEFGPDYIGNGINLPAQVTDYSDKSDRQNFFNTGSTIQNDVTYADKGFFMSLQDANIKGIVPGDKNRRTGLRFNADREYGRFKVGLNANYIQQNYNIFDDQGMSAYNTSQGIGLNQGLMNLLFNTGGFIPLKSFQNFDTDPYAQYNNYYTDYGLNPYFAIDNWRKTGKKQDFIANLNFNFKVTDWLNLTYRAGITSQTTVERKTSEGEAQNEFGRLIRGFNPLPGSLEERSFTSERLSQELFGTFNKQITADFKINGNVGYYLRQDNARDTRVGAGNLVVPELYNISQRTGNLTGTSSRRQIRLQAFYGNANLNYKGWANIEVSGRSEQTSVLDLSQYSYFYPAITGSLILSDAIPAIKATNAVSYLKLRGGWNKTANANISPYTLQPTFSQVASSGFPYGSVAGYTAGDAAADPLLRPERVESFEAGFEAGFWKNRISLEATYFHSNNTDQIIPISVSNTTGYTTYQINAASFINKGVELDLGLTPLVDIGPVRINFKVNATYNESEVTSIYPGLPELGIGSGYTYASNYAVVGQPAFVLKATDYNRDPATGRVIVSATSGAPTANPLVQPFGNTLPKWIIGLAPTVKYKGLSLSALFEYKGGYYAYSDIGNAMAWTGVSALSAVNNRERFVFPNSAILVNGAYVPNTSVTLNNPETFFTGVARSVASNYIINASAWRMRELNLGFDLPASLLGKTKVIKAANIAFTARNLFVWVPKSNMYGDPDFTFSPGATSFGNGNTTGLTDGNQAGISNSTVNPPVRTFGGTITLTF